MRLLKKETDINLKESEILFRYFIKNSKEKTSWNRMIKYADRAAEMINRAVRCVNETAETADRIMTTKLN